MENTAFIALGSNMGNRYDNLTNAIEKLTSYSEIQLVNYSSIYETDPVGYEDQDLFLNMVIEIQTALSANGITRFMLKNRIGTWEKKGNKMGSANN